MAKPKTPAPARRCYLCDGTPAPRTLRITEGERGRYRVRRHPLCRPCERRMRDDWKLIEGPRA